MDFQSLLTFASLPYAAGLLAVLTCFGWGIFYLIWIDCVSLFLGEYLFLDKRYVWVVWYFQKARVKEFWMTYGS